MRSSALAFSVEFFMPTHSSKDHDFATNALRVVAHALGEKLTGEPLDNPNRIPAGQYTETSFLRGYPKQPNLRVADDPGSICVGPSS